MVIKKKIDLMKFGWKPIHRIKGVPWPRIAPGDNEVNSEVPLKEIYRMRSMDYLDTDEAKIIFETQADIIIREKYKGIVDVGCRIGRINDILHEKGYTDYDYMGFDTSPEPIDYAKELWEGFDRIEYRNASWNDKDSVKVGFDVDCVIWSGVLLYQPLSHLSLFKEITFNTYNSANAIIQEPLKQQKHWQAGLSLKTIAEELEVYKNEFVTFEENIVEAEVFSGNRIIVSLKN